MQKLQIDNLLMALSVLLTSPENYVQIDSQYVDVSSYARIDGDNHVEANCKVPEMRNLSNVVGAAMDNQLKINERMNNILLDLQAIVKQLSTTDSIGCDKQRVGEVIIKLPNLPTAFPVWCITNKYGDNWLLIAHRNADSKLFLHITTELVENSIGDPKGEYFIGFKKLRAITENQLCELLITEYPRMGGKEWYDHYGAVAFGADNKVKMLGLYRTNRLGVSGGLTAHAEAVNEKLTLKSNALSNTYVRIYLRRATLDTFQQLKQAT